jgi:hypothetical protein
MSAETWQSMTAGLPGLPRFARNDVGWRWLFEFNRGEGSTLSFSKLRSGKIKHEHVIKGHLYEQNHVGAGQTWRQALHTASAPYCV